MSVDGILASLDGTAVKAEGTTVKADGAAVKTAVKAAVKETPPRKKKRVLTLALLQKTIQPLWPEI